MDNPSRIVEVTNENFDQTVLEASHAAPVLVDFWAEWCQPCKQLFPILNKLVDEYGGRFTIGKLNIDEQGELAAEAGVRSVPMVLIFRKGMVTDQFLGLQPESAIREIIERNLFRESDRLMDQARDCLQRGDNEQAAELARQAMADDPENNEIRLELAQVLLAADQLDELEELIADAPLEVRESAAVDALLSRADLARAGRDAPTPEELRSRIETDPRDSGSRYQLAAHHVANNDIEAALEQLLAILQHDRKFRDDAARRGMIALFGMLDDDSPLLHRYRTKLSNALH